ncbi:unnamed protein product [Ilex paraguariensis]|uniref:Pentatricopeptide repeat-containing protein n=1 Tax=Ilex paraguariensis TaxID=185542 RepID=A0ABC8SZ45_9AQUA
MNKHARFVKLGLDNNAVFATKLINDYVSYKTPNSLSQAHQLFDQVPRKDTVLWTSIISAYTRSNNPHKALQLFSLMLHQAEPDQKPNNFVFATIARAIASSQEDLCLGRSIHAHVLKSGFIPKNVVVETALVDMYSKCHLVGCARNLFDEMSHRNLVTWNAMISGYAQNGMEKHSLELFHMLKCQEMYLPDEFSVATVLSSCALIQDLVLGIQVHGYAIIGGFELSCVNSIANMYFFCGEVPCAEEVSNGVDGDVISKLIKIRGYAFNQRYKDALKYVAFKNNIIEIFKLDYTIVVPILSACAKLSLLNVGKQVHGLFITLSNSFSNIYSLKEDWAIIGSALIDMYSKCRSVGEAKNAFENWLPTKHVSHWNSMILGCISNGLIEEARTLLEDMPEKNVVTWTSMISGYVRNGMPDEGLQLLCKMYSNKDGSAVEGNCSTFVVGLEACSYLTDMERGRQIHAKLIRTLTNADISNVIVGTALVDMYSKSGYLNNAKKVFDLMLEKNVFAWTSVITGYAVHGFGFEALEIFQQMLDMGTEPNEVTFVSVLTACSHCGLVDEGLQYVKLMREKYSLVPREDHYTCLIDLLGRVGRLEEAWGLLEELEDRELSSGCITSSIWAAMLGACQLHGNVEMGRRVAKKMLDGKKQVSTTCVALYNVYATAGMWTEAYRVRERWRKEGTADGEPGLSRICTHLGDSSSTFFES